MATWLGSSRLCLNVDKSTCMLIGSRQVGPFLSHLVVVCCLRYILFGILVYWLTMCCLGTCIFVTWFLELDQDLLQWFSLGLYHLQCLCVLYSAFVMPLFDYCDVIWTPSMAKQTCLIERVHSKFVHKLPSSYHFKFPFTLIERRWFHTAIQIFKSLHWISPYLHDIFKFSKDATGHFGCVVNHLFVPRVFTNYGKRSFYYRGTVLWNTLKSTVTGAVALSSFRTCYLNSWFFVFVVLLLFVVCVLFSYVFLFIVCIIISLLYVCPGLHWKSVLLSVLPYNYNYKTATFAKQFTRHHTQEGQCSYQTSYNTYPL